MDAETEVRQNKRPSLLNSQINPSKNENKYGATYIINTYTPKKVENDDEDSDDESGEEEEDEEEEGKFIKTKKKKQF